MQNLLEIFITNDPVLIFGLATFSVLLIALPLSFWSVATSNSSSLLKVLIAVSNLLLTALLIFRWIESAHFPISNLYESLCFLTWGITFSYLLVERIYPSALIASVITPISLLLIGFASFTLPDQLQESSPLVPALRSSWLVMHVSVIMSSYAALIVGSLISAVVLFKDTDTELNIKSNSIGSGGYRKNTGLSKKIDNKQLSFASEYPYISPIEQLDTISYRTITLGFLLLTFGLISGSVWANEAWGSWWSWDPKETWAFICWLVYAAYLHSRFTRGWQGRKPAMIAIIGLFLIFVCYIGVNLLGIGLHSYGWFF